MTVRAILFEDLDETSLCDGAMAMGTQGLEISKTRTADGRNWDWTTAMTAEGIMAGTIIAGIISDKTGKSWWNLDTGEMQMTGRFRQFTSSGLKSVDIHDNKIDLFAWDSDGHYVGSFRAGSALDKSYKSVGIVANCGDRVTLGVLKEGEEVEEFLILYFPALRILQRCMRLMEKGINKRLSVQHLMMKFLIYVEAPMDSSQLVEKE